MAYIDQERKSEIAPLVKGVLAKYGIKGTLSIRNHSTLVLTIKSGRINFCQNWFDTYPANYHRNPTAHQVSGVPDHIDVNVYHIVKLQLVLLDVELVVMKGVSVRWILITIIVKIMIFLMIIFYLKFC